MSRDVLLACLALALLLNLALLGVVTLRPRRGRAATDDRARAPAGRSASPGEPPRRAPASRTLARPSATSHPGARFFVPAPGNGSGHSAMRVPASSADRADRTGRPRPAIAPGIAVDARAMAAMLVTPRPGHAPTAPSIAPLARMSMVPPPPRAAPVEQVAQVSPPEPAADAPVEARPEPPSASQKSKRTRGRRFVLPPLDEDQDRSAAAIEAFLGGAPPPGATAERPQRRRHRARRATGSPVPRTTMLVWLQGFGELDRVVGTSRASHVSNAFFDALRRLARTTDEVREVGTGRVRVVIDADDAGASAYVERARASVQPWLELLTVPLRVETAARESTEVLPFGTGRRVVGDR